VSLFIAAQIGVFALVLFIIAQIAERYTARARSFVGQCVEVSTRQGVEFRIFLECNGAACLVSCRQCDPNLAPVRWRGEWQLFPEGTAVRWNIPEGASCKAGEFGLISWYGDSLIYEGYAEGFARMPDFLGQVHARAGTQSGVNTLFETARRVSAAALPAPTGPEASERALATASPEGATL
jgi:hypothetical protein